MFVCFFFSFSLSPLVRSSIESEPALVLGPLRSLEEQRQEQQLQEIQLRRQERERRAAEEDGGARDDSPPIQEKADELTGPFHYEFSYWARSAALLLFPFLQFMLLDFCVADWAELHSSLASHVTES